MMVFLYGTELAMMQDKMFDQYKTGEVFTLEEVNRLAKNQWIKIAEKLAPNNLVVRNHCLADLIKKKDLNVNKIVKLCSIIGRAGLWLEGYSYWLYTKSFLTAYTNAEFVHQEKRHTIKEFIRRIDKGFLDTAYTRSGALYPAPFGDLRDEPLESALQGSEPPMAARAFPVMKQLPRYYIIPEPLGLNLHTATEDSVWVIKDGKPVSTSGKPFPWYTGYTNKYPNVWKELSNMLSFKRILSIFLRFR